MIHFKTYIHTISLHADEFCAQNPGGYQKINLLKHFSKIKDNNTNGLDTSTAEVTIQELAHVVSLYIKTGGI